MFVGPQVCRYRKCLEAGMLPDKVDAGWKKGGEQGEEEPQERRRVKKKKELVAVTSSGEKLTERDIYMINKGMEMEIKMRTEYGQYRRPDTLLYQQRNYCVNR